jgi:hypothetical protein
MATSIRYCVIALLVAMLGFSVGFSSAALVLIQRFSADFLLFLRQTIVVLFLRMKAFSAALNPEGF